LLQEDKKMKKKKEKDTISFEISVDANDTGFPAFQVKTFRVKLPRLVFDTLYEVAKHSGLSQEDLVGNGILCILAQYPKISKIKKVRG